MGPISSSGGSCWTRWRCSRCNRRFKGLSFRINPAQMIGTTVSHYRIVEELGSCGMRVVYKAEGTRPFLEMELLEWRTQRRQSQGRGQNWRAKRLSGFPGPLEGRRPRRSRAPGSQVGIREVKVARRICVVRIWPVGPALLRARMERAAISFRRPRPTAR